MLTMMKEPEDMTLIGPVIEKQQKIINDCVEKKSLEAHVELCAERYKLLELKLETLESNVEGLKTTIDEVHNIVQEMAAKRNDQLVTWGSGIIGMLLATVGWLVTTYVFK